MFGQRSVDGIEAFAWAYLDSGVQVEYTVYDDQVQLRIGGPDCFEVMADEGALATLVDGSTRALADLRAGQGDQS